MRGPIVQITLAAYRVVGVAQVNGPRAVRRAECVQWTENLAERVAEHRDGGHMVDGFGGQRRRDGADVEAGYETPTPGIAPTPGMAPRTGETPNIKSTTAAPCEKPPRTNLVAGQFAIMNWT